MTAKLSKTELLYRLAWGFHPTPPQQYRDENWLAGKGIKFRLVQFENGRTEWTESNKENQLTIISQNQVTQLAASFMSAMLLTQDWKQLVDLVQLQAMRMDNFSTEESMVIKSYEVKPAAFADDPSWTWNRIPFIPCSTSQRGIWPEVLARMETNVKPFMAWVYSLFIPHSSRVMAPWIYGPGGTGKSKVIESIVNLFGNTALVKQAGKQIGRFDLWNIADARLVHFAEAASNFCQSSNWKAVTGDNTIEIERKYEDSRLVNLKSKFVITSNHLPDVTDEADMRRLILVPFGQISGTVLSGQLAEIALRDGMPWMLSEAKKEYEADSEMTGVDRSILKDIRDDSWDVELFHKHFEPAPDGFVTANSVADFFDSLGWNRKQAKDFKLAVSKAFPLIKPISMVKRVNGKVVKVWEGLKWRCNP